MSRPQKGKHMKRKSYWHQTGKGPDRELGKFYQGLAASKPNEHHCPYCIEDFPSKKKRDVHVRDKHYGSFYRDRMKNNEDN